MLLKKIEMCNLPFQHLFNVVLQLGYNVLTWKDAKTMSCVNWAAKTKVVEKLSKAIKQAKPISLGKRNLKKLNCFPGKQLDERDNVISI